MKFSWNCSPSGSEIRTRLATDPSRLTRKWVVMPPAPVGAVISPTIRSSAQESRKPKIKARKIAIRAPKPRKATVATTVNSMTGIATTGSCGQDNPDDDRRESEPDQHDHRPADHGGQDLAQSAATNRVDQPADGGRREPRHQHDPVTDADVPPSVLMATPAPTKEADVPS